MNIHDWLSKQDEQRIADETGASVHNVRKWRTGARIPRRASAIKLIELSQGELSLQDIYAPGLRNQAA